MENEKKGGSNYWTMRTDALGWEPMLLSADGGRQYATGS